MAPNHPTPILRNPQHSKSEDMPAPDTPDGSSLSPNAERHDAIIIGGGLTGLTIADRLRRKGKRVLVLEKLPQPGGVIRSERRDGFLCEAGPNSLLLKAAEAEAYLDELGLADQLIPANPDARKRFLVRDSTVLPLPTSPFSALRTPLYSPTAKLRFLKEPWRPRTVGEDTSVAEFVRRRLGREFLNYAVAPLVSGVFAGDARKLSIRHAFPKIWQLEARSGSLVRGSLALRRERQRRKEAVYKPRLVSFPNGLATLPQAQAKALGGHLVTGAEILKMRRTADGKGWHVEWRTAATEPAAATARHLVVTTPTRGWAELPLPPHVSAALEALPAVNHPPVATLVLGFKREQVGHPLDGFGVLLPPVEQEPILGTIFSSSLFPDRAPEGHVSLMNFLGGSLRPELGRLDASDATEATLTALRRLLRIKGEPVFTHHTRWPQAIPQYHVGYGTFLDGLERIENDFPGLHLRGNFRGGPGLNDVMVSALSLADRLAG